MVTIKDEILAPFFIEQDDRQYIVKYNRPKNTNHHLSKSKEGGIVEETVGFHISFAGALKSIARQKITLKKESYTLAEYIAEYKNITKLLENNF